MEKNKKENHDTKINNLKMTLGIIVAILLIFGIIYLIYDINSIINPKRPSNNSSNDQTAVTYRNGENFTTNTVIQEEGVEIAKKFLANIGYEGETIKSVENQKLSNNIENYYRITTNSNLEVLVDINKGKVNSFFDNNNYTIDQEDFDEDEAKSVLMEKFNELKADDDYTLVSFEKESDNIWVGYFNKKYGELYNRYQGITLKIIPELDKVITIVYFDEDYKDTEIIISKEEAINIVKNKVNDNSMEIFNYMEKYNYEELVFFNDSKTGLKAITCIHSTKLGPSLGGRRLWNYNNENEAIEDVLRLQEECL